MLLSHMPNDVFDTHMSLHFSAAGRGHIYNNYFRDIDLGCINSRMDACVRVQNNYFENARDPWLSRDSSVRFPLFVC